MPTANRPTKTKAQPARRGVIYTRISLDKTSEQAGVTRQKKDCLAYCKRHGIDVVEVLTDDDVSASRYSRKARPGYLRALELLDGGAADTLVAWHLDRLYRQPKELEAIIDRAEQHGLRVVTVAGGDLDLNSGDGRAMARVITAMAAKASDDTSRRIKRQKAERRNEGLPHGGRTFGWLDGMTPDEGQAEIVREIFARYVAGDSLTVLATDLNARHVPQVRGGTRWKATSVRSVLSCHRHAGLVATTDATTGTRVEVGKAKWPAIVDRKTFDQAQALLEVRGDRMRGIPRRATLLTGLVKCGRCGCPLRRAKAGGGRAVLACRKPPTGNGCGGLTIGAELVEDTVTEAVLAWADDTDLPRLVAAKGGDEGEAGRLSAELAAFEAKSDALNDMWLNGKLADARYAKQTRALDERREALSARLVAASAAGALSPLLARPGVLRERWDGLSTRQRRDTIAALLDAQGVQIVVSKATPPRQVPNPRRVAFAPA